MVQEGSYQPVKQKEKLNKTPFHMLTFPLAVFGKCCENVPVECQSGHTGAAAVVAQTGVDPRLGEDDIDLVLLVREERSQYSDCSSLYLFF